MITRSIFVRVSIGAWCLALIGAIPAVAQTSGEPKSIAVAGGVDFLNQYMFRGVRQNATPMAMWPFGDLGIATHTRGGAFNGLDIHAGFWNSLQTGDTGSGGPTRQPWYESDLYAIVGLRFAHDIRLGTTYRMYRSPNSMFTTVNEMSLRLSTQDLALNQRTALAPYVLAAFEFDTRPGMGQVDGGQKPGRYLELGLTPRYSLSRISFAIPAKVGLSVGNYYELAGKDHPFGFTSVAGMITVPFAGTLNVHGGVEYQRLGTTTKAFNGGESSKTIASIGVGFSR